MTIWKPVINLLLRDYILTSLEFLKICLKKLVEEIIYLFEAPIVIKHLLLQLSTLWRWQESCGVECWGLRPPLSKYSYFSPNRCPEIVWCKPTLFRSLVHNHYQVFHCHCITLCWRPRHDNLKSFYKSFSEWFFFDLLEFFENLLEKASRRNYLLVWAPNVIQHLLL
jgi:hypothetical protein